MFGKKAPREQRRYERFTTQMVSIIIDGADFAVINWSLGGFILAGAPGGPAGSQMRGRLRLDSTGEMFPFTAAVVRRDDEARLVACRFIDPSPALLEALGDAARAAVPE